MNIRGASDILNVPPYMLRWWEKKLGLNICRVPILRNSDKKSRGYDRKYFASDIELFRKIAPLKGKIHLETLKDVVKRGQLDALLQIVNPSLLTQDK